MRRRSWSRCRWPAGATRPGRTCTTASRASTSEYVTTPGAFIPGVVTRTQPGALFGLVRCRWLPWRAQVGRTRPPAYRRTPAARRRYIGADKHPGRKGARGRGVCTHVPAQTAHSTQRNASEPQALQPPDRDPHLTEPQPWRSALASEVVTGTEAGSKAPPAALDPPRGHASARRGRRHKSGRLPPGGPNGTPPDSCTGHLL